MGVNDNPYDHWERCPSGAWGIDHHHVCTNCGHDVFHEWDDACGLFDNMDNCIFVYGEDCADGSAQKLWTEV